MKKTRVAMTVSLPYDMARDYTRLARQESKNKSELFRTMFQAYKRQTLKEDLQSIREYGWERAKAKGVFTEEDIERIVAEARGKR